ncbi:MAG: efflux RND transporter periplasmic adaptor subunit [Armatimonadetes bacterium]|nr:efflux RND transporter periplasmic adaptor subunit [Armatimonadota bacterium]
MRRRRVIGCLAAVFIFLGLAGYGTFRVLRTMAKAKQKPLEFTTVRRGDVVRKVSETGTIAAELQVEVKSKVAGRIAELFVDEGDPVREGQLLALIDPTEVERAANQAEADVRASRARLEQAEWAARQQQDNTRLSIRQAEARLAAAEANLRRLQAGSRAQEIARAEAQVARAQAEAEEARAALKRALELQRHGATAREDAEAALAAAQAELARLQAGARPEERRQAEAAVAQARATLDDATRALRRKQDLAKRGFVPRGEAETAQASVDRAQAALVEAQQRAALVEAGPRPEEIAAAQARVRQAEIAARSAASNAEQTVAAARARAAAAEAALRTAHEDLALLREGPRPEDLDAAKAQVAEARAALAAARAGASRDAAARAEVEAARADVLRTSERLEAARVQRADTRLVAPFSGTVAARHIQAGELVASGVSGLSAGVPVVTIADLSTLLVRVRLNEVDVARVRPGQQAEVRVDAYPGVTFPGRVRTISPAAGPGGQAGQESQIVRFDVEVALVRPDPRLRTGMSADVDIILSRRKNVLYVTREALTREGKQWVADVVRNPRQVRDLQGPARAALTEKDVPTRKVTVKVGLTDDMRAQVLSGLKQDDLILVKETGKIQRRRLKIGP